MTQESTYYEDEISLRELILILVKGKNVIVFITAISIILSGLVSYFIIEPTYESNTILLVSNASSKPVTYDSGATGVESLMNTLSANIPQTITTYKEQMLTTDMMTRVIEKMSLEDQFSPGGLKELIVVSNIKDTNLLNVTVTTNDPILSTDIANNLAEEYTNFIAEMNSQRLAKSSEFLKQKVDEEKQKLDAALEVYKEFLAESPGTSEIQAEISSKSGRLNSLKSEYDALVANYERDKLDIQNNISLKKKEISDLQTILSNTSQFIVQNQSVLEDNTATAIVNSTGATSQDVLNIKLENEVINENYMELDRLLNISSVELQTLEQKKTNLKVTFDATKSLIESEIVSLTQSLEKLKVEYAEKNNAEKLIQKDVQRAESSYDQFVKSYEENRVAESADIGKSTILINSKAVVNEKPVGPRKTLNVAIAAILGLMVSVFYVFFKHYWNESK